MLQIKKVIITGKGTELLRKLFKIRFLKKNNFVDYPDKPNFVEIEPTLGCDLRCRTCHVSFMKEKAQFLDFGKLDYEFFRDCRVNIGALFEPTIHPKFNQLIENLNRVNSKISMITNAKNLHKRYLPALFESNLELITFSFDGISKETYEHIRRGGDFEKTLNNIENFVESVKNSSGKNAHFHINYTTMLHNLAEVSKTPEFWNSRGIDSVGFIRMQVREDDKWQWENSLWNHREEYYSQIYSAAKSIIDNDLKITMGVPLGVGNKNLRDIFNTGDEGLVLSKNNLGKKMPRLQREAQYGADFGMQFDCKSPFVSARITADGNVSLCHNKIVGNIYDNSLNQIWNGYTAKSIRTSLVDDSSECSRCDYFNLCINSHSTFYDDIKMYFSQEMLKKYQTKL